MKKDNKDLNSSPELKDEKQVREEELIRDFIALMHRLRDYALEVPMRGSLYKNIVFYAASMFEYRKKDILELINGQVREEVKPQANVAQSVEGNLLPDSQTRQIMQSGQAIFGIGEAGLCDGCPN